jgi:hypothetical protein
MSAQHAAEMIVHHTQAAAYHQGKAAGRQEAMRLVRQVKQRLDEQGAISAAAYEELARMEEILYDLTKESEGDASRHNAILRDADATLSNDQR